MEIHHHQHEDTHYLALHGAFDVLGARSFDKKIASLKTNGGLSLVISFAGVPYISSQGAPTLETLAGQAREGSFRVTFSQLNEFPRENLKLMGFGGWSFVDEVPGA